MDYRSAAPPRPDTGHRPLLHLGPVASVIIVFCGLGASLAFMGLMAFYLWWCSRTDPSSDTTREFEGATGETTGGLMSKKALAKLRSIDYQSLLDLKGGKDNVECCAVCLVEFHPEGDLGSSRRSSNAGDKDRSIRMLPMCGHYFHTDCIEGWLGSYQSCPLCRTSLLSAENPAGHIAADEQQDLRQIVVEGSDDPSSIPHDNAISSARSSFRMSGRVVPLDTGSGRVIIGSGLARELGASGRVVATTGP